MSTEQRIQHLRLAFHHIYKVLEAMEPEIDNAQSEIQILRGLELQEAAQLVHCEQLRLRAVLDSAN